MDIGSQTLRPSCYELRFARIDAGKEYVFPCDAAGHVDLDALGERLLNTYLCLRAVIGGEVLLPTVRMNGRAST